LGPIKSLNSIPVDTWLNKLRRASTATATKYARCVHKFENWLAGKKVSQSLMEEFLEVINASGKSSVEMVAALKYRYVTFGKTNLTFKGLAETSKH
jgi:hypothetical protein